MIPSLAMMLSKILRCFVILVAVRVSLAVARHNGCPFFLSFRINRTTSLLYGKSSALIRAFFAILCFVYASPCVNQIGILSARSG